MKTRKLKSMIQFILDLDWMNTVEFCEAYGVPLPKWTGDVKSSADKFLQVDVIKHRLITDYAKFLNKKLTIEMFEGDKKIFNGGHYIDRQPSTEWNCYTIRGYKIFEDRNGVINGTLNKRVEDLIHLNLEYNEY